MRIVQIAPDYVPVPPVGYGGIERIVYEITEMLVQLGHEVFLYALPNSSSSATIIEYPHVGNDQKIVQFVKETLPNNVDIIHDHTHGSVISSLPLDIPYISTIHIPSYNQSKNPVFASSEIKRILSPHQGFVIPHGLNENDYPLKKEKEDYLLFLGRLVTEKGIHHALEVQKRTNRPLIIAGPTDVVEEEKYRTYTKNILKEIKENPKIQYVGEVAGVEKIKLIQNAYCMLFPSEPEAFGLVMIEALFCGTPVLGFNHGSVPEVIGEFPVLLCNSAEDMATAILHKKMPNPVILREHALKNFTSKIMAKQYVSLFKKLLSETKPKKKPNVSVLLPVYNSKQYVKEAIESILHQTYTDFELLLLDNGSTDGTSLILDEYEKNDQRVTVIHFNERKSIVDVLNYGISISNGEFIVRMDSDDISLPNRFIHQVHFLVENPEIGLVGTAAKVIGRDEIWDQATDHEELRCQLLLHCCFIRPTIMIRKSVLTKNNIQYRHHSPHAEDYELYRELSMVTKLSNLSEVLLHYRHYNNRESLHDLHTQQLSAEKIKVRQLQNLVLTPTNEQLHIHFNLSSPNISREQKLSWIKYLILQNKKTKFYDTKILLNVLCQFSQMSITDEDLFLNQKKICFLVLVHENRQLVIELINNIQYFCPNSSIVLYNGGEDASLCENLNIPVCPTSRKLKYGYTTIHFIETMQWLERIGFKYDYLINIDSDALFIREGYEQFVLEEMKTTDYLGIDLRIAEESYLCKREIKKEQKRWEELFNIDQLYGVFNVAQIMSRKFIQAFLSSNKIELLSKNLRETTAFGTDEVVFVNSAKELGFKIKKYPAKKNNSLEPIGYDMDKWFIRYRPHLTIQELIHLFNKYKNRWLVHPVHRLQKDITRQFIYRLQDKYNTKYRNNHFPWYKDDDKEYYPSNGILNSSTGFHELIVTEDNMLTHFYCDNGWWKPSETFAKNVNGKPVLYESSYKNLEVIVPILKGGLGHWWRNSKNKIWNGPTILTEDTEITPLFLWQLENRRHIFVGEKNHQLLYWIRDDGKTWRWSGPYQ